MTWLVHILYFAFCVAPIAMAGWFGPQTGACSCCSGTCECVDGSGDPLTACTDYPTSKIVKFNGLADSSGCDNNVCTDLDQVNIVLDGGDIGSCGDHYIIEDMSAGTSCIDINTLSLSLDCIDQGPGNDNKAQWTLVWDQGVHPGISGVTWTTTEAALPISCKGAENFNEANTENTEFDLFGTPTWPNPSACEFIACTAEIIS